LLETGDAYARAGQVFGRDRAGRACADNQNVDNLGIAANIRQDIILPGQT